MRINPNTNPRPNPKEPATTYDWICGDMYCKTVDCFRDPLSHQCVARLWEATASEFHDAELARATKQINGILNKIEKGNKDPKRKLSLIKFQNRHLLVWAGYGLVGAYDDERTVIKALGLKVPARKRKK
jgi:hypothetical protein